MKRFLSQASGAAAQGPLALPILAVSPWARSLRALGSVSTSVKWG